MSKKKQQQSTVIASNSTQARRYMLTINNPKQSEQEFHDYCAGLEHVKYFIFQREKGEKKETEHYQVYIEFTIGKRFETIKKYFPRAHIEKCGGSKTQNRDYCSKQDTRIGQVYEYGEFADERARTDLKAMCNLVKENKSEFEIMELFPSQSARYHNFIPKYKQAYLADKYKKTIRNLEVIYIYGTAGSGKTRYVMDKFGFENVCRVTDYSRDPFFAYDCQDVLVFEEFRSSLKITDMLNYLDLYPLQLPSRYTNKTACYTKVYIISNIPIYEQYKSVLEEQKETWQAFRRRIHKVHNFDSDYDPNTKEFKKPAFQPMQLEIIDDNELPF